MTNELDDRLAVNGVELAWGAWGEGPTLVLCHGFSGSAHDFDLQLSRLSRAGRVVTLDQRGHGRSTKCGQLDPYRIEQLAEDLAAFLGAVGGGPVDLLGHSMGGRVVLEVALEHPELVRSLILMDTSAWSFEVADDAIREMLVGFFASYDPTQGLPDFSVMSGPEDPLIEAATDPQWRERKESLLAEFDPYALVALGHALFSNSVSSRARPPSRGRLPGDRDRRRARPPLRRPGSRAGRRGGGRGPGGDRRRLPLTAAHASRGVGSCGGGAPRPFARVRASVSAWPTDLHQRERPPPTPHRW